MSAFDKARLWYAVCPEIALGILRHAVEERDFVMIQEKEEAAHRHRMDLRLWWTNVIGMGVGMLNVALLAAVAWHYADTGNIIPGLMMFGAGTGATAGVYAAGRAFNERINSKRNALPSAEEATCPIPPGGEALCPFGVDAQPRSSASTSSSTATV